MAWATFVEWLVGPRAEALRTIASVVSGVGSAAAVLIAAVVYRKSVNDARTSQARQVVLSVVDTATLSDPDKEAEEGEDRIAVLEHIKVANLSELPIFNVEIFAYGQPLYPFDSDLPNQVLEPGRSRSIDVRLVFNYDRLAAARFTDSGGRSWLRYHDGTLKAIRRTVEGERFRVVADVHFKTREFQHLGIGRHPEGTVYGRRLGAS